MSWPEDLDDRVASLDKDIVRRLRQGAYNDSLDDKLMKDAANEIERLRELLSEARTPKGYEE